MTSQPTRVLIAEDEALIRLDLKEMLEEEGYTVVAEVGSMHPGNGTWPRCGPPDRGKSSAPGATRTHTARVLNPLPLPIGVRGRAGAARLLEQPSGEVVAGRRG